MQGLANKKKQLSYNLQGALGIGCGLQWHKGVETAKQKCRHSTLMFTCYLQEVYVKKHSTLIFSVMRTCVIQTGLKLTKTPRPFLVWVHLYSYFLGGIGGGPGIGFVCK